MRSSSYAKHPDLVGMRYYLSLPELVRKKKGIKKKWKQVIAQTGLCLWM